MIFGYHVNGLPTYPPGRTIELLDEVGYGSVALPVGGELFDPREPGCWAKIEELAQGLRDRNLGSIVEMETCGVGAKGDETRDWSLIGPDPSCQQSYVKLCEHAIDAAATLRSDCVVLRSGTLIVGSDDDPEAAWDRLTDSLAGLLEYAEARAVLIGFEPTSGMLIDTTDAFNRLLGRVDSSQLRLSLDIGSLCFSGETPLPLFFHVWSSRLVNIHLCDVKASEPNRRLMPGAGEVDFPPLFSVLDEVGYLGGIHVRFDGPILGDGSEQMGYMMRFLRQAARLHL